MKNVELFFTVTNVLELVQSASIVHIPQIPAFTAVRVYCISLKENPQELESQQEKNLLFSAGHNTLATAIPNIRLCRTAGCFRDTHRHIHFSCCRRTAPARIIAATYRNQK